MAFGWNFYLGWKLNIVQQLHYAESVFSDSPKMLKKRTQNPFVRNTVEVWFKDSRQEHMIPVSKCGLTKVSDLYDNMTYLTFETKE